MSRAFGEEVWGRRVARLPARGTLLFATDLQGNLRDYQTLKAIYAREEAEGNEPVLLLAGDLIHGPSADLHLPGAWPEHLGTPYEDASRELVLDYLEWSRTARTVSLLGNHEHAHVGGPRVAKFHRDEAAVLDDALGPDRERVYAFFRTFPLIAVAPCGAAFTHGAPAATERSLEDFERLTYSGYERTPIHEMIRADTVGALLWARSASREKARAFLAATALGRLANGFAAYGHDIVREGWCLEGPEQVCVSTSFGLFDDRKVYLRLALDGWYSSAQALRPGIEIVPLHP